MPTGPESAGLSAGYEGSRLQPVSAPHLSELEVSQPSCWDLSPTWALRPLIGGTSHALLPLASRNLGPAPAPFVPGTTAHARRGASWAAAWHNPQGSRQKATLDPSESSPALCRSSCAETFSAGQTGLPAATRQQRRSSTFPYAGSLCNVYSETVSTTLSRSAEHFRSHRSCHLLTLFRFRFLWWCLATFFKSFLQAFLAFDAFSFFWCGSTSS